MVTKPNVYVLGGTPEPYGIFTDKNGVGITPVEMRISVKQPDGVIYTVSGADLIADTTTSGMFYTVYRPLTRGWYEYEVWGKDGNDREIVQTNGFEVGDRVY